MNEARFIELVETNEVNRAILAALPELGLADSWLVSGSLFQTVWNALTGRAPGHGIKDYDVFYFDLDTSWEAEDRAIRRGQEVFADLGAEVEIRNQARVHLWYEEKFGRPYPPLTCATDGIDRFLAPACMVGISAGGEIYAPRGFDDIEAMVIRSNPVANFDADELARKAARWQEKWPELRVLLG